MKINIASFFAITLGCLAPGAHAASPYVETFNIDNDDQGWFAVTNATTSSVAQNPTTDRLDFSGSDYTLFYFGADAAASGGAFAGDLATAGIYGFQFDLTINTGSQVSAMYFEITNLTEDETWQYSLAVPAFGSDTSFFVPLGSATGWIQTSGSESFAFILGQTEEVALAFSQTTSGNLNASIDNITAVPEPSSIMIAGLGLLAALRRRRIA